MRNIWIIARREYKLFFISPVAYVVAFFFMILLGYFFYGGLVDAMTYSAYYGSYAPGVDMVIGPMVTLLVFAMPAMTMRSIAEEMKMGTMELLLTAPITGWELIVGKGLG